MPAPANKTTQKTPQGLRPHLCLWLGSDVYHEEASQKGLKNDGVRFGGPCDGSYLHLPLVLSMAVSIISSGAAFVGVLTIRTLLFGVIRGRDLLKLTHEFRVAHHQGPLRHAPGTTNKMRPETSENQ